ncbi:unnamed protein product [Heligmosomoides polygyrus]|uniref:PID domain-containing protein n=1 Tax=Heligmosomoides polygyrus TaxID=6339 RepID=A0A3P8DRW4_HELPZ|nr:unnamed protein product [Heligmosomoides polygyrus]
MALPLTAAELRGSGIQFAFEYLGSVPVIAALHEMTADMRPLVVKECINMVAAAIGLIPTPRPNVIMQPFLGEPRVTNHQIELNISTKALTIIHSDKREPERFNRMIARHNIEQVSFAAQGSEETSTADMFGYIAKLRNGTDRRCHVFRFKDVQRVMHIIDDAIRIATRDMAPQMAPPIQPTSGIVNVELRCTSSGPVALPGLIFFKAASVSSTVMFCTGPWIGAVKGMAG